MMSQPLPVLMPSINSRSALAVCKSKRSLPNYLFRVGFENVGVRKLDNYLKGVRD